MHLTCQALPITVPKAFLSNISSLALRLANLNLCISRHQQQSLEMISGQQNVKFYIHLLTKDLRVVRMFQRSLIE